MRMITISLVILLMMAGIFTGLSVRGASESSGIRIEGPTVAPVNTTIYYNVTVIPSFDKYRCTLLIAGENLTGAKPLNEVEVNSTNGKFMFNITTPRSPQRIYLDFKAYGMLNNTNKPKVFERRIYVDVKKSVTIIGKIKNTEKYTVSNITVNFYVDGRYIGNTIVKRLNPNSTVTVKFKWAPSVSNGVHKLEMRVNSPGIVFPNGEQYYYREIYVGSPPQYYTWAEYIGIATAVTLSVLLLFVFMSGGRGRKRSEPKWKKS